MTILGIDPGTARTGYGILKKRKGGALECMAYGVLTTPPSQSPGKRLILLEQQLKKLLLSHRPRVAAVETHFFFKNLKTAFPVSQARGVVLLVLAKANMKIIELSPLQTKMAIAGYGRADKKQVQRMVKELLGLKEIPKPDDAADALALAISCTSLV